jgi:putative ABC transport system permease protein
LPVTPDIVANEIKAQQGTQGYFASGQTHVTVPGLAGDTLVIAYIGDSSWGAYQMVSGSWFTQPGEAVVPSGFLTAINTHVGDTITLANNGHETTVRITGEVFDLQNGGMVVMTPAGSLNGLNTYTVPESVEFDVKLTPGTDKFNYLQGLNHGLQSYGLLARPNSAKLSSTVMAMDTLAAILTVMLVAVAGLGVLNVVVLDTRERVHDLGVMKAIGMSPRQTVAMVLTSVGGVGLVAGLVGVPIGVLLHEYVLPAMADASGTRIPAVDMSVYSPLLVIPLILGGLVIAAAGAFLPAGWASRTRTAIALRAE